MKGGFRLSVSLDCVMPVEAWWGLPSDVPEDPTAEAAATQLAQYVKKHGWATTLSDWNLEQDIEATVDGVAVQP